jgi:RNA polymerase sigma-70 factor (ECF subfamily)
LQDADAADVTQDVMSSVATGIRRFEYDPGRGSFRGWMAAVTRNKLRSFFAARERLPAAVSDSIVEKLADESMTETEEAEWNHDFRRRVFEWAAGCVRGEVEAATWEAFRLTAIEGAPGAAVAGQLQMSIGTVYVARSRVLARLRSLVAEVSDESPLPDSLRP